MRVRYKSIRHTGDWSAIFDLSSRKAKQIFEEMKTIPTILWAELIGEDEDNYMQVLEGFDHDYELAVFMKEMGGRSKYEV